MMKVLLSIWRFDFLKSHLLIPPRPSHTHSPSEQLMPLEHMSRYRVRHVFLIAPSLAPPPLLELLKGRLCISQPSVDSLTPPFLSSTPGQKMLQSSFFFFLSSLHFICWTSSTNLIGACLNRKIQNGSLMSENTSVVCDWPLCPDVIVWAAGGEKGRERFGAYISSVKDHEPDLRAMVSSGSLSSCHHCSQDYTKLHWHSTVTMAQALNTVFVCQLL